MLLLVATLFFFVAKCITNSQIDDLLKELKTIAVAFVLADGCGPRLRRRSLSVGARVRAGSASLQ